MVNVPEIDDSLFIRTWFGDEAAWQNTVTMVQQRSPEGFIPYVVVVDDPQNENAPQSELHELIDYGEAAVAFVADELTQTQQDNPVLVLDTTGDEHTPFRVPLANLWKVENDMNLGDMDWEEARKTFSTTY